MAGEKDCIKERETKKIADNISDSQLIIVPNASHSSYIVHNAELYTLIENFIRANL